MNDLWRTRLSLRHLIWFLPPVLSANCLFFSVFLFVAGQAFLRWGGGRRRLEEAKSYDREKAWTSIKNSILSGWGNQTDKIILCHEYFCVPKNQKCRPTPGLINIRRNRYTYWYLISYIPCHGYSVLTMPDSVHSLPGTFREGSISMLGTRCAVKTHNDSSNGFIFML
jgi:hypothetical protein